MVKRRVFNLPHLPAHPKRSVVDRALNGAYRRIRFSAVEDQQTTIQSFFEDISSIAEETKETLLSQEDELKVCTHLSLIMLHKVESEEHEVPIFLNLKSAPLSTIDITSMEEELQDRLDTFLRRGSNFKLKTVKALEWEVCFYESIPFHVGHRRQRDLPPKLAHKKAVVNIQNGGGNDCFK
jgi:hypothetical protein